MKSKTYRFTQILMIGSLIGLVLYSCLIGTYSQQVISLKEQALQSVAVETHSIDCRDGTIIQADIYIPKNITSSNTYPLVLLQHGFNGRKENMASMAISFCNRNFIVITSNLRNHYGSSGYTTLGNKESDDILVVIRSVQTILQSKNIMVKDVGVVGHSLGALSVSLAAIKGNLNSCVAISPLSNLSRMIKDYVNITFDDIPPSLLSIPSFNNITDSAFMENITLISKSRPKNYLLIAGHEDYTIRETAVRDLFYAFTQNNSAQYGTLYGNFEDQTAIQMDVFTVANHGSEQYAFEEPEITLDCINWTERALQIQNPTPISLPSEINFLQSAQVLGGKVLDSYVWGEVVSLFCVIVSVINIIFWEENSVSVPPPKGWRKHTIKRDLQELKKSRDFQVFLLGSIPICIAASFISWSFLTQFLLINVLLDVLTPVALGCMGGMVTVFGYTYWNKKRRDRMNPESSSFISSVSSQESLSNHSHLSHLSKMRWKSPLVRFGLGLLFGLSFSYFATAWIAEISDEMTREYTIKQLPSIPGVYLAFGQLLVLLVLIDCILSWVLLKHIRFSLSQLVIACIIVPLVIFVLAFIRLLFSPFNLFFTIMNLTFWIPPVLAMGVAIIFLIIESVNQCFRLAVKNNIVGTVIVGWIISWMVLSVIASF